MGSAYSFHTYVCNCGVLRTLFCGICQFGLRVIYHLLHFQLQIPPAKYLFSVSLWGMRKPNSVFAIWKTMWKLVSVRKYCSNFSDQRTLVFKWCSCLGLFYFRVINLLIFSFCFFYLTVLLWSGDNHFGGQYVAQY
jgi:hypothetical protein